MEHGLSDDSHNSKRIFVDSATSICVLCFVQVALKGSVGGAGDESSLSLGNSVEQL